MNVCTGPLPGSPAPTHADGSGSASWYYKQPDVLVSQLPGTALTISSLTCWSASCQALYCKQHGGSSPLLNSTSMQLHFLFCVIPSQIMIMMKDTWSMVNTQCEVMKFWFHTNGWMFMFCIGKISHTVAPVGWLAVAAWTFLANHKNQCHDLSTLQCKCKNSIHTPLNKVIILSDNYWLSLPVCSFTVWTWLPAKWQTAVRWSKKPAHNQYCT
jgi:hypothetical protein